ncbi:AAA family ATPase [Isoptericola sp. b515]|uniref:ATP-dependent nuclease n=1 Tax=Isoptericola sp. b515 TaxID=3064652 RepID=UPI0027123C38|nr:AAA family ATPase [Isoptericola sp. b515]MDO8148740.1 AAA family ATPase [Isoptericola sp. b515]
MYLRRVQVQGMRGVAGGEVEVDLPGRFSVLIGANGSGKTTIADAIYLAHHRRFPTLPRPSAASLGPGERAVRLEYYYEEQPNDEGPLGKRLQAQTGRTSPGTAAAWWSRTLRRDLGTVRAETLERNDVESQIRLIYLPAWRNPVDELSRREARILIELLRAQQQDLTSGRDLTALRAFASGLLEHLAKDEVLARLEQRVAGEMRALSAGVRRNFPYIRGQVVDDSYLARVLELMLATVEGRENALPLEVVGLGYVNLLHIAVTLAAIPRPAAGPTAPVGSGSSPSSSGEEVNETIDADEDANGAENRLQQARAEAESAEDSFFPDEDFHVTLVIEEPEAHIHPQLQHALVRYLRRQVEERPELQVILSSHAPEIISACDPEDLVVVRRLHNDTRVARSIARIPFASKDEVLRKTRLHLDASRSAALFSDRVLLVEGVTDAALVREFGRAWAAGDDDRQGFVDALSIVPMGTKVGSWAVRLLATRGDELCSKVAVLRDSDLALDETPAQPGWAAAHDPDVVRVAQSHPTLEPQVTAGNEGLVTEALRDMNLNPADDVTVMQIYRAFRSAYIDPADGSKVKAGRYSSRKGEFSLALAALLRANRHDLIEEHPVVVPEPIAEVLDFLYGNGRTTPGPFGAATSDGD